MVSLKDNDLFIYLFSMTIFYKWQQSSDNRGSIGGIVFYIFVLLVSINYIYVICWGAVGRGALVPPHRTFKVIRNKDTKKYPAEYHWVGW